MIQSTGLRIAVTVALPQVTREDTMATVVLPDAAETEKAGTGDQNMADARVAPVLAAKTADVATKAVGDEADILVLAANIQDNATSNQDIAALTANFSTYIEGSSTYIESFHAAIRSLGRPGAPRSWKRPPPGRGSEILS